MSEPVLVIMAAGMGSRYGGLKQMDPIDSQGHLIIDFSIYDALKAGFKKIVFIIKHEIEEDFKEIIGDRISKYAEVDYVFQQVENLPSGYSVPNGRVKPWGTGHAVLCCKRMIDSPFAVINADDYYGADAFQKIYNYLNNTQDDEKYHYAMVGYVLENTLTENGHVARGVCEIDENGMLGGIQERTHIEKTKNGIEYTEDGGVIWTKIPEGSTVSMNMWGFSASILGELQTHFTSFLEKEVPQNPIKAEYFLPSVVGQLLQEQKATVNVLKSQDKWYGVTYKQDKEMVVQAIAKMKEQGEYPDEFLKA